MAGPGGARPGAGRPRKREKFAGQIAAAEQRIADRLPELIDAQFDLALGVTVQEVDRTTGATVVYTRPPDARAGQYLIDRILGKPTQSVEAEVDVPADSPLVAAFDAAVRKIYGAGDDESCH